MTYRRKKKLIDFAVQGAIVRRIVLHWLIFFALAFLALPLWQVMRSADFLTSFSSLMVQGWIENAPVFAILIALLPLFAWDTVKFTNRFAGPMYRLHQTIRSRAAGEEVPPVRFRKGDYWTEVADDFNAMMERIASEQESAASPSENEPVGSC